VHRDPTLSGIPRRDGGQIDALHGSILEGETPDGGASTVNEDVAAEGLLGEFVSAIDSVWIIDAQGEMKLTARVESIQAVKALGDLEVSLPAFGSEDAAGRTDGDGVHQDPSGPLARGAPDLEAALAFEAAKHDPWGPGCAGLSKGLLHRVSVVRLGGSETRRAALLVSELPRLGGDGEEKNQGDQQGRRGVHGGFNAPPPGSI